MYSMNVGTASGQLIDLVVGWERSASYVDQNIQMSGLRGSNCSGAKYGLGARDRLDHQGYRKSVTGVQEGQKRVPLAVAQSIAL